MNQKGILPYAHGMFCVGSQHPLFNVMYIHLYIYIHCIYNVLYLVYVGCFRLVLLFPADNKNYDHKRNNFTFFHPCP